ncbi:DUF3322 and DUF2220 domain-containing protein [Virgisporangium aurantiacum]
MADRRPARRAPVSRSWTVPGDVVAGLRKRWDRGEFLAAIAEDRPWEPVGVPIRAPSPTEIASAFGEVQDWAAQWRGPAAGKLRVEYRPIGGRAIGANLVPARAWLDTPEQLWSVLGVTPRVRRFTDLVSDTRRDAPTLVSFMTAQPMKVLAHEAVWPALVRTVRWIADRATPEMYLRQVDVPGVDTKFIERHRTLLADLLDRHLPDDRVDRGAPPWDFARRYRFRGKPRYVRLRHLDARSAEPFTEVMVRVDELACRPPAASTVYVVENEITYLAFPPVADAIVVLGGGYAVPTLHPLAWLTGRRLIYWGDIDTHGFAILDRLRQSFPHAGSMLMDRATLLAHDGQWVREPTPTDAALQRLDPAESALYRDLVEDALGPAVRLEQERVRFSAVTDAVGADPA